MSKNQKGLQFWWDGTEYDKDGAEVATYSEGVRTEK